MASPEIDAHPGTLKMAREKTQELAIQPTPTNEGEGLNEKHDLSIKAGELTLEEDTAGGMGRHLGVFSTTFLM